MSDIRERHGEVAEASARLDLGEFELFGLAHRRWFGRAAAPAQLERTFAAYMFHGTVPPWVRHYAREILRADPADPKAARRLGLDRLPSPAPAPRHGKAIVAAAFVVFLLLFTVILNTTYDPATSAPIPARPLSCAGGGPGLVALENLAYAFAGRERPSC